MLHLAQQQPKGSGRKAQTEKGMLKASPEPLITPVSPGLVQFKLDADQ